LSTIPAPWLLFLGGIRIERFDILGMAIDLGGPVVDLSMSGYSLAISLPSLLVTMFWFLACMNIWNLIDGMDGLASGVGLLVSGTLTLVAIHNQNVGGGDHGGRVGGQPGRFLAVQLAPGLHLPR
jgi:UDP-GlcNAc:undecaprenyl-phosphate GlcNAc-1-phosphate transferase